ncbi:hypothetical protein D3C71_1794190 [compost metagenome]
MRAQAAGQMHGIAGIQLGEDAGAMRLHGAQRYAQIDGDDLVGPASRHIVHDLPFTGSQG